MLLGPIFQVEMVSTARRRRYFALRMVYGALILFVLWASYQTVPAFSGNRADTSIRHGSHLALVFFYSFSWLQMLAVLAIGPALGAGTIASERERRTIEYLFATDLANHEIVLGKTTARLLLLGKLVLVGLPILFLFRLLGGIPANLLLGTFLLTGSTAVMVTAVSIWISVGSARARDATLRVYSVLAALLFLPTAILLVGRQAFATSAVWQDTVMPVAESLRVLNPLVTLGNAMGQHLAMGQGIGTAAVLKTVGWQLVVAALALAWATFAVRRVHLGAISRGDVKKSSQLRLPRYRPALVHHPMIWKEAFAGTAKARLGIAGTLAVALIVITTYGVTIYNFVDALFGDRWTQPEDYFTYLAVLTGLLGTCMLLQLGSRAAGLITLEKERDCWTSLLATPLTGREIMTGKMLGNLYGVRWSLLVLASAWALGMWINPGFLWAALAMGATFLLAAWFTTNLGLTFSLHSQTTLRSMGMTLATLTFTSGGYLFCCCVMLSNNFGGSGDEAVIFAPCIPFLLAFPAVAYYDFYVGSQLSREPGFMLAYGFGIAIYLVASAVLYVYMIANFDRVVGRTGSSAGQK